MGGAGGVPRCACARPLPRRDMGKGPCRTRGSPPELAAVGVMNVWAAGDRSPRARVMEWDHSCCR
ncbi:hypothetical protein NSPZN2_10967 [Nitrospira defluvii]|uniref:Uncharacterized protein n=1 Tax=Nitrospira defluvii TaxID=330214 RepID=A0ABM8QMV8_9BACT|nr:hypothetical protein NSPZN2_10967 [Nitrospira defluvii]